MMKDINKGCYVGCFYYTDSCFRDDCMSKPARYATGKEAPGQIVNEPIITLNDYIKKVEQAEAPSPKKLTFEEWYKPEYAITEDEYFRLKECWHAAQENFPSGGKE